MSTQTAVEQAIAAFKLPEQLGFGRISAPVMFSASYENGEWREGQLIPFGPIELMPNARSIQFAESVFEGMKAYRVPPARPHLFRPLDNAARFARSATRIGMPPVPESLFLAGLGAVADACADFIPTRSGSSLYLRPTLFSTEGGYDVVNSGAFRFLVLASPSEPYSSGPMRVRIERDDVRAARGGVGAAKTGGNYAAAMRATTRAVADGCTVSLWLDPQQRKTIEELSGMNIFAVINGEIHTPVLSDSILAGITRDSVLKLAAHLGYRTVERPMPIDDLLADIATDRCSELFASGTAAILNPIESLLDADGRQHRPGGSAVSLRLRQSLLDIQEGRAQDPFGWIHRL